MIIQTNSAHTRSLQFHATNAKSSSSTASSPVSTILLDLLLRADVEPILDLIQRAVVWKALENLSSDLFGTGHTASLRLENEAHHTLQVKELARER